MNRRVIGTAMSAKNTRLILFAIFSFTIGTWIGYYWRSHLNTDTGIQSTLVVKGEQLSDKRDLRTAQASIHQTKISKSVKTQTCTPKHNVMFLKTHKTASSAVQNVLIRYSEKHDLTVGLSNLYDIRFHYGQKFKKEFVAPAPKPINMIMHHMVFDLPEVEKVMPKKTSSYITILREPGSLFESMFDYFHYNTKSFSRVNLKQPNSLEQWLDHADTYFRGKKDGMFWWFAKNGVFFDMGYDNLSDDDIYIQKSIDELDKAFDLVLLSDYFDQSMILLKDHLCWSFQDVLALKMNARSSQRSTLTEEIKTKIRKWNKADSAVYDHFNHTFWEKVTEYGHERMQNDLKILAKLNAELQNDCVEGDAVANKDIKDKSNKIYNPAGVQMTGYNIKQSAKNNATCVNLLIGEIQWTRDKMAKLKAVMGQDDP